jgi:putative phosphoesterase
VARAARNTGALVERHVVLPLRDDGGIRVVVVADTHGLPHPASARCIAAQRPDAILHAGDIGDLRVLEDLGALAPLTAVRGNIDTRAAHLPDVLTIDLAADAQIALRILLLHIAVYGPKLHAGAARLAQARNAQLVICGHSHVPFIGRDRGLSVFNPGSIGPRRFRLPIVFGVLALEQNRVKLWHVSCETGERWEP